MQPIRKNELEFHEKLIEKKASSQKNELDRKIRVEAEKLTEKSLSAFKKKIKADKLLEAYKNSGARFTIAYIDSPLAKKLDADPAFKNVTVALGDQDRFQVYDILPGQP